MQGVESVLGRGRQPTTEQRLAFRMAAEWKAIQQLGGFEVESAADFVQGSGHTGCTPQRGGWYSALPWRTKQVGNGQVCLGHWSASQQWLVLSRSTGKPKQTDKEACLYCFLVFSLVIFLVIF